MQKLVEAKFSIGNIVKHRFLNFRGVIFDLDPEFNNTEEWYLAIPEQIRPIKEQPFYHLFAENEEIFYRSFEKLDKSKPVYLYCRSGNRSKKSADILIELGFSKVYDLNGGFIEWNLNELK